MLSIREIIKKAAFATGAIVLSGTLLFGASRNNQVEKITMLQTFDNPEFMNSLQIMASGFAEMTDKEDHSFLLEEQMRRHPNFTTTRQALITGFDRAIQDAGIQDGELDQIVEFFQSPAGKKWFAATGNSALVEGFESVFSLMQDVVDSYPDSSKSETDEKKAGESSLMSIDEDAFSVEVLQAKQPVVVDLYADWCGPCKRMTPIFSELAGELADQVKFVKCNVDQAPSIVKEYEVEGIPTFLFFSKGELQGKKSGLLSKEELKKEIDTHLL